MKVLARISGRRMKNSCFQRCGKKQRQSHSNNKCQETETGQVLHNLSSWRRARKQLSNCIYSLPEHVSLSQKMLRKHPGFCEFLTKRVIVLMYTYICIIYAAQMPQIVRPKSHVPRFASINFKYSLAIKAPLAQAYIIPCDTRIVFTSPEHTKHSRKRRKTFLSLVLVMTLNDKNSIWNISILFDEYMAESFYDWRREVVDEHINLVATRFLLHCF